MHALDLLLLAALALLALSLIACATAPVGSAGACANFMATC